MLKNRLKVLLFASMGAVGLILLTWAGMRMSAKHKTAELDEIAAEFFQKYPVTEQNTSAKTLETLSAQLGLTLVHRESAQALPTLDEAADFQTIRTTVQDYFASQKIKDNGALDALPASVQTYLNDNQAALTEIQTHLNAQDAPVWHFDPDLFTDWDAFPPSFLGLVDLHKLLLLNAINHDQKDQPEQMVAALEATQVLFEGSVARPDLLSYLVSLIAMDDTVAIMRYLEGVPSSFSEQLLATDQQQLGVERLQFESWAAYQAFNRALNSPDWAEEELLADEDSVLLAVFSWGAIEKPYLRLSNNNTAHIQNKNHEQLRGENICSLDVNALDATLTKSIPWWNILGQIAVPSLAAQWRKGGDRMLSAELTHHIVRAKALAAEQGQWPETLADLDSQTCPGEQWVYKVSPEGQMSLSFSRELDWRANANDPHRYRPLTYQAVRAD